MKSPVEQMLNTVDWTATHNEHQPSDSGLPYTTHEGVLNIGDMRLRCYRLSTGIAVFDADDVKKFFEVLA